MKNLITILILFCAVQSQAQKRDTIAVLLVYADTTHKSVKGFYYVNDDGSYTYLSATKKPLTPSYKIYFPIPPITEQKDTILPGYGIKIDKISKGVFIISADSTNKQ